MNAFKNNFYFLEFFRLLFSLSQYRFVMNKDFIVPRSSCPVDDSNEAQQKATRRHLNIYFTNNRRLCKTAIGASLLNAFTCVTV